MFVSVLDASSLATCPRWQRAFRSRRKDRRYYEILAATLGGGFSHRYFAIEDGTGQVRAIQPFFTLRQDLLQGSHETARRAIEMVRAVVPNALRWPTLMVGCAAGEGHLDDPDEIDHETQARLLAPAVLRYARENGIALIVLKEFPSSYRPALAPFLAARFSRVPSLPMTRIDIDYPSFEDYVRRGLKASRRRHLLRNLEASRGAPLTLEVTGDISGAIEDVFPLYLQVFERTTRHFEKLTPEFLLEVGRRMPDKARFFIWRLEGRAVAFSLGMIEGDSLCAEYLGLDYAVAFELHLYHRVFADGVRWAMANGLKQYRSTALNYQPKLRLGARLEPLDLYVRHRSDALNPAFSRVLPLLEPTRNDPHLPMFPNAAELWG